MNPNDQPKQFWLTSQDKNHYLFLATLVSHEQRTATLLVERVRSEAAQKGMGLAEPRPLNREPYAEVNFGADGSAHLRLGTPIPLANGTDRDGILWLSDAEAFNNHVRLLQWLYWLWGELLPEVRRGRQAGAA